MSDPSDIDDRLEAAAVKAEGASEIMRRFANEPIGVFIDTESGPLPSVKEWLDQQEAIVGELPSRVDDLELFDSNLSSAASPSNGSAKIARGVQVVSSISELRLLLKTSPSKYAQVADPTTGFFATYRYNSAITSGGDIGVERIAAADGGYWDRLTNARRSGVLYKEYGAAIEKFGDRVFIGDAAACSGTNETIQGDWLTTYQISCGRTNGFIQSAQSAILTNTSPDASNGLVVAARTSNLHDNYNAVAIIGIAVADKTTGTGYSYAGYFEAYRGPGALGGAYGNEVDTINYASYVAIDPYNQVAAQTIGHQMAAGGEYSPAGQFDASAAYNIQYNGAKFGIGINFGATAITGTDGVTGTGIVAAMAKGHMYQWYAGGVKTSSILGNCATPSLSLNQVFVDNQFQIQNQSAKTVFRVFAAASSVNYVDLRSSVTGAAVQIVASGDDTNIDTIATGKGSGMFGFGTYTAGAPTPTGYVTIRTAAGQTIRLSGQLI